MKQAVDMSDSQPTVNWPMYAGWSRIAIIKATEGVGYTASTYLSKRVQSAQNGVLSHFYHFARYDLGNFPATEAQYCYQVIGQIASNQIVFVDVEENGSPAEWALEWLQSMEAVYGHNRVGLYASLSYIQANLQLAELGKYWLWLADWKLPPPPAAPWPWTPAKLWGWQYTDIGAVPGIPGNVDVSYVFEDSAMNLFTETSRDFSRYFKVDAKGNWEVLKSGVVLMGSNRDAYNQMSMDGQSLPIPGLPVTSEIYIATGESIQFFERAIMRYDPTHSIDNQPGLGVSYLAKYEDVLNDPKLAGLLPGLNLPTVTVEKIPATVLADIQQLAKDAGL